MRLAPSTLRPAALAAAACGALLLLLHAPIHAQSSPAAPPPAGEAPDEEAAESESGQAKAPDDVPLRRTPQVTVTATRAEREVLEVPGNLTVLEREEIEESGARDLPDLLRRQSGIFVTNDQSNPEGYTVEARGFQNGGGNGSGLLVLVDGQRVNEADTSTTDWALLPLEDVERVEILRGPANAVWGDNAIGGVVQIFTTPPEGPARFTLQGRTGSFDRDGGSLSARGAAGPVGASLFLDARSTDAFRERAGFRARRGRLSLRLTPDERTALELAGGYSSDRRERPGTLTRSEIETLGRDGASPSTDENFDEARVRWLRAALERELGAGLSLELRPFHRRRSDVGAVESPGTLFTFADESEAYGLTSQVEWETTLAGRRQRLVAGADWSREEFDRESASQSSFGTFLQDTRARRLVYGFFLQEELELTSKLLLTAGLRWDQAEYEGRDDVSGTEFDPEFDLWSPKAALTYRLTETASVYGSFSRGFRFPNFDEAFGIFGSSPSLEPERSTAYELGAKIRRERVTAGAALYQMDVTDEIFFDAELGSFGRNVNFDRIRHRGLETQASWRPVDWLELYGSYTYDDARIRRDSLTSLDGERVPITPRHRGTAGLRLRLPGAIRIGLNGSFVGSRSIANDLENDLDELEPFSVYDAELAWSPRLSEQLGLELSGAVRNAFDRDYTEFAGESTTSLTPRIGFNPSPGRHYEVALRLRWTP